MFVYDKDIYDSILSTSIHSEVELFIEQNESEIIEFARKKDVDIGEVRKQIRLHLPKFDYSSFGDDLFFNHEIIPLLDNRFKDYLENVRKYLQESGYSLIADSQTLKIKGCGIVQTESVGHSFEIEIREVTPQHAEFIESKLHYLRGFRQHAMYRTGLYLKGFTLPICYMSFCDIDRDNKREAVKKALGNLALESTKIVELSRVFGCGNLPLNTISFLISRGAKHFRTLGFDYLITAVNPSIGFSGTSMIASGFSPFASRPVRYRYSTQNGGYIISRSPVMGLPARTKMPSNILYIREIRTTGEKKALKHVYINDDGTSFLKPIIEMDIYKLRGSLEKVWNDDTRYHGSDFQHHDRPSKGQCGVSSMHLARHLQSQGYDVRFCEGDVSFPDNEKSILNHCWIKLLNYTDNGTNVIVDITADQNGYEHKVIFRTEQDLASQNIKYEATSELHVNDIGVGHLIERLVYLESELKESK